MLLKIAIVDYLQKMPKLSNYRKSIAEFLQMKENKNKNKKKSLIFYFPSTQDKDILSRVSP